MKHILIYCFLLAHTVLFAQTAASKLPNCTNMVVWNFSCDNDPNLARILSFEVEAILTEIKPGCRVLERRRFATLNEIIEQEGAKANIKKTSKKAQNQLLVDAAETVMFGKIKRDDDISGGVRLELEIDDLHGEKLKSDFALLNAQQMLPADRKENLRPFIYDMVGMSYTPPKPKNKDMHWDTASRGDTKESYERYIQWCQSGAVNCQHESEARKIVADEREWDQTRLPMTDNKRINTLCRYLEKGNTRHIEQAKHWLSNMMDEQRQKNTRGWILGVAGVGAGVTSMVIGGNQIAKGDLLYNDTYAKYKDPFDPVYQGTSRDAIKDKADAKKTTGTYLKIGGGLLIGAGIWCMINRFRWQKTLQRGNELVIGNCIQPNNNRYAFASAKEIYGIGLQLHF